jgi:hypothetical protein
VRSQLIIRILKISAASENSKRNIKSLLNAMLKICIIKAKTTPNAEQIKCSALTFPEAA